MELHVTCLTIEVTRRCNMRCEHCLRGDAEDRDISPSMIDQIFDTFAGVYDIVPTGGEPFLVPDLTAQVLRRARDTASTYFIATNGTVSPFSEGGRKIMEQLAEFRSPEESARICVSCDKFHDTINTASWEMIRNVEFDKREAIIKRGRALWTGVGNKTQDYSPLRFYYSLDEDFASIEDLYVTVDGDVFSDYDLSYSEMADKDAFYDRFYLGHISRLHATMEEIVSEDYPEYAERESYVA